MKTPIIFLLILTLVFPFVLAENMPELPMIVQGKATINGDFAQPGTLISAKVGGETIKKYTLTQEGDYVLTIPTTQGTVDLYLDNIFTNQSIEFSAGRVEEIDLNVQKKKSNWIYWLIPVILVLVILLILFPKWKKSKHFKNRKH